jgi:membrane-bound lytic murein transglycosylase MltF
MTKNRLPRPYAAFALFVLLGAEASAQAPAPKAPASQPPPAGVALPTTIRAPWTGDLDGMIKRRRIRVLVPYNKTQYFIEKGAQRGLAYETGKKFEDDLNTRLKTGHLRVNVVFIPMSRDELFPALLAGKGDVVAAALTITPAREKLVDFTTPYRTGVSEIVVTGPSSPKIAALDDLAGQPVFVRASSSFHESLLALNQRLKAAGKREAIIKPAPETLEDEDLLEMLNAGLVKVVIVDDYMGEFWKQVFPKIVLHPTLALRTGGQIAPAIRPNSPKLKAALDAFAKTTTAGTAFGNIMLQRYLSGTRFTKTATASRDMERLQQAVELFRKYGDQYELDWLLMAAQGYQESGLDQNRRSHVGAIGVMQVMPATGKELKVGDITKIEANIHAGVKYIRFMIDTYYADEPMDQLNKGLFAFAAYNCGPGRVRQLRRVAAERGLNPNLWFNNVERIASEKIGRETVTYVSNIYKYYIAYKLAMEEMEERRKAKEAPPT